MNVGSDLVLPRPKLQPVVQPAVGQPPGLGQEDVFAMLVIQTDAVAGIQELAEGWRGAHKRPAGVAASTIAAQDQDGPGSDPGEYLVVFHCRPATTPEQAVIVA
jgi:hypothetical protein